MNYKYTVRRKASQEIQSIFDYYYTIKPELAERFLDEIDETILLMCRYPLSRSYYFNRFRGVLMPSFPYFLFYTIEKEKLVFHAVFPAKNSPEKLHEILIT